MTRPELRAENELNFPSIYAAALKALTAAKDAELRHDFQTAWNSLVAHGATMRSIVENTGNRTFKEQFNSIQNQAA